MSLTQTATKWNETPEILAARDIAKRFNKTHVVVIMLDDRSGTINGASYGSDGDRCRVAGKLMDVAYKAVLKYFVGENI